MSSREQSHPHPARPFTAKMYREYAAGEFSRRDGTVAFYNRIDALLEPSMTLFNLGAGRGANILADSSPYRRRIQTFKGRARKVIGADFDLVVRENPDLDEAYLIEPSGRIPVADESVDIIVADHVLEHVEHPDEFAREVDRVLKPGGWFCARTPGKWGYIGLAARMVPNRAHVGLLSRLQPQREARDVFPTFYRLNTFGQIARTFPRSEWHHYSYGEDGDPGYHANRAFLFRLIEAYCWLMPQALSAKIHVFLQKKQRQK